MYTRTKKKKNNNNNKLHEYSSMETIFLPLAAVLVSIEKIQQSFILV